MRGAAAAAAVCKMERMMIISFQAIAAAAAVAALAPQVNADGPTVGSDWIAGGRTDGPTGKRQAGSE